MRTALHKTASDVVAVTNPSQMQSGQLSTVFLQRIQIGKHLAWMSEIGQPIDDGTRSVFGKLDHRRVSLGADHDHVDHLAQDAGKIGDTFAFPESGVVAEHQTTSAEVGHAGLEADTCAKRLFLE